MNASFLTVVVSWLAAVVLILFSLFFQTCSSSNSRSFSNLPCIFSVFVEVVLKVAEAVQGVSFWNGLYKLALTDKNMQVKLGLKMVLECWDREFLGTTIIFQKSGIGWPQQPLTEKVLKFNLIFHDSTPKKYFFKTSK